MAPDRNVRSLRPGEASLLRDLRLRALKDAPEQFGETLEEALARTRAGWEALTASVVPPSNQAMFIAEVNGAPVGSVFALNDVEATEVGRLGGMWVAPEQRHQGIGMALVEAVQIWALNLGKRHLRLWVACDNGAGRRLYERAGFQLTGAQRAFPGDLLRVIVEMDLRNRPCDETTGQHAAGADDAR
ncbi:GNAT family N-acetyltransferase [Sorangium sp. So ce726]|uniref:GNAT family N-acetyltransferase n=1 Tax=Sorangium sp. So ce726 TaxID=3133319 RepID=UPI003F5FA03D